MNKCPHGYTTRKACAECVSADDDAEIKRLWARVEELEAARTITPERRKEIVSIAGEMLRVRGPRELYGDYITGRAALVVVRHAIDMVAGEEE